MVKFCPDCEKIMTAGVSTGTVIFTCPACGKKEDSTESERILYSHDFSSNFNPFARLIIGAADDPAGNKIDKKCPDCGSLWMARIRLGDDETPVLRCKCGYTEGLV